MAVKEVISQKLFSELLFLMTGGTIVLFPKCCDQKSGVGEGDHSFLPPPNPSHRLFICTPGRVTSKTPPRSTNSIHNVYLFLDCEP